MNIYLEKVKKEDKLVLFRLLQYSLFEESETDLNEMNNDGLFDYEWFDDYFINPDRHAFFIKDEESNKLLGFVMINNHTQIESNGHCIAEFLVIPKYRRNKIGKQTAFKAFEMFKGNWEVKPSYKNEKAFSFWENVIKQYTNNNFLLKNEIFIFSNNK